MTKIVPITAFFVALLAAPSRRRRAAIPTAR